MQVPVTKVFLALVLLLILVPVGNQILPYQLSSAASATNALANQPVSSNAINGSYATIPISLPSVLTQAKSLGEVGPTTSISFDIMLPARNSQGLTQFLQQVNDPQSSIYHRFLTQQQYNSLYGPDASEAALISSYFSSHDLKSTMQTSGLLQVTGSALNVEKTLNVSIQSFQLGGMIFYSATSYPKLPSAFSNILGIYGLQNYDEASIRGAVPLYRTLGQVVPNITQSDGNFIYYSPSEIRQAYNASSLINAGYNGSGITIAIIDAYGDPFIQQELDNFSAEFNMPSTHINQICVDGPCDYSSGITQGWNTEIALDVEWAHAMAPGATINLYIGSNSSQPLFDAVEEAVSNGTNSIISMSWGTTENTFASSAPNAPVFGQNYPWLDQVLQQAAAEGITAFASSGDWGAYDQGFGQTSSFGSAVYPSTDPYVTGVGGTSLYLNTTSGFTQAPYFDANATYGKETAWSWNNAYRWGTGGGYSTLFPQPSWQNGPGVQANGSRGAPDVAWDADVQTGVAVSIYNQGTNSYDYYIVGGTSVGSPSWAGSLALIDQKNGGRLGLLDPQIYSILQNKTEYSKAFHDVTSGNSNPLSAGAGWDPLTGVGSPNIGELSDYLAPSGTLSVAVQNSLSAQLSSSYSYSSTVGISALVKSSSGTVSSGTITANITSNGVTIAQNLPLSYNPFAGTWTGAYQIKQGDPPGEWTATIHAQSGTLSGFGSTTFSVGDGITMFMPFYNVKTAATLSHFFQVGQKINISAAVTNTNGNSRISSGSYVATFYLGGSSGVDEGSADLAYNSTSRNWEGSFTIPKSAEQGAWTLVIRGVDSQGNLAVAYSWLNVGLNVMVGTDSPNYVLGDAITILAAPQYSNLSVASSGIFHATITAGSRTVASIPMTFSVLYDLWVGYLPTRPFDPTGFYKITVSGDDGYGNSGSFYTTVRVAPFQLQISPSLPSSEISVFGGNIPSVSARIAYPNATALTTGSVEATVYFDMGAGLLLPIHSLRLTYQASSQSFVAPNVFQSQGPLNTTLGRYIVNIQGIDAYGSFGNVTTSFYVLGTNHSPITIMSDSQFSTDGVVLKGNGTLESPYVIAGWNTTSISIGGSVTANYQIMNDWVQGSSGDGITVTTANSDVSIISTTAVNNAGNGIYVSSPVGAFISAVSANDNGKNGIVIANNTPGQPLGITLSAAANNTQSGILSQSAYKPSITYNSVSGNGEDGIKIFDSFNASVDFNVVYTSSVGIEVTGSGGSYGAAEIEANTIFNDGTGILVNGLGQTVADPLSASIALARGNVILNNSVGISAINQSVVEAAQNTIGLNGMGISYKDSLPLVISNLIAENVNSGLVVNGGFSTNETCQVTFVNQSSFSYNLCIASNLIASSSTGDGVVISNLNDSLIYGNSALFNAGRGYALENLTDSTIRLNFAGGNSNDGIAITNSSGNVVAQNEFTLNQNGLAIYGGKDDQLSQNNSTLNFFSGILLQGSTDETVTSNIAANNTFSSLKSNTCSGSGCATAGGIDLLGSSGNSITKNLVQNNTGSTLLVGYGIVLDDGSDYNYVFQNNVTNNEAGIGLSNSISNLVSTNVVENNKYGVYYTNAVSNILASNSLASNMQDVYPDQPKVAFTSPIGNNMMDGIVKLAWSASGQSIVNETIIIDGNANSVNGTSYSWNTAPLADGAHTVTIVVENSGGFNASASIRLLTDNQLINNRTITVNLVGPGGLAISNTNVRLSNSSLTLNGTTDQTGSASFHGLHVGVYVATYGVNATDYSAKIDISSTNSVNPSVVLFVPMISTTFTAVTSSGQHIVFAMSGNITSAELSSPILTASNGLYSLSFTTSISNGSAGSSTITIPKSYVPEGLIPTITVDGSQQRLPSTQDQNNYYVTFFAPQGTHNVVISFTALQLFQPKFVVPIVVVIAAVLMTVILVTRRKKQPAFMR